MALDALEKERLRKKMAITMEAFQGNSGELVCVSGHWTETPHACELCGRTHGNEILVLKNRKGRKMKIDAKCVAEMVKFHVIEEVEGLSKWLGRMGELRTEAARREEERRLAREEERKKLERRVIVRRRPKENELK